MKQPEPKKLKSTADYYDAYRMDRNPANLNRVVASMNNTISYKLASMGVNDNPQMRHQAKLFAAEAVKSFNPASGTHLRTWTQSQLQSMQRFRRENQGPVKIPDRASIDAWTIERSRRELEDELGYDPDVQRLADKSGLSVKRIAAVKKITRPVSSTDSQLFEEGGSAPDYLGEALDYVYHDSDTVDRKIIELTTGYGGTDVLQKNEAASKLGISASQITRRTAKIGARLQEMDQSLEQTHS